jgi:hypothetical protein
MLFSVGSDLMICGFTVNHSVPLKISSLSYKIKTQTFISQVL